jgi:hypothetical protein
MATARTTLWSLAELVHVSGRSSLYLSHLWQWDLQQGGIVIAIIVHNILISILFKTEPLCIIQYFMSLVLAQLVCPVTTTTWKKY